MILVIIYEEFGVTLKMRQKKTVADFLQELMHSLAYRPDLGSLHSPQYMIVFLIFQECHM